MDIDPKTGSPIPTTDFTATTPPTKSDDDLLKRLDELKNQHTELSEAYMLCEVENQQLKAGQGKLQDEIVLLNNRKPHLSLSKKQQIEVSLTRTSMDSQQRARVMEELELIINA